MSEEMEELFQESDESPLAEYLADDEEIVTTHRDDGRTVAVTTERLIQVTRTERETGPDEMNTRALLLSGPAVRGTDVTVRDEGEPDLVDLIAGGVFALIGLAAAWFGLNAGPSQEIPAIIAGVFGVLLLAGAAKIVIDAFDTEDGGVEVTVLGGDGDESVVLPRSAEDVAAAATRAVGEKA
jgi:hypothetical protein